MDASFGPVEPTDALFQPRVLVSGQSTSQDPLKAVNKKSRHSPSLPQASPSTFRVAALFGLTPLSLPPSEKGEKKRGEAAGGQGLGPHPTRRAA